MAMISESSISSSISNMRAIFCPTPRRSKPRLILWPERSSISLRISSNFVLRYPLLAVNYCLTSSRRNERVQMAGHPTNRQEPSSAEAVGSGRKYRGWRPLASIVWLLLLAVIMLVGQAVGIIIYVLRDNIALPSASEDFAAMGSDGGVIAAAFLVSTPIVLASLLLIIRTARVPVSDYLGLKLFSLRDGLVGAVAVVLFIVISGILTSIYSAQTPGFMLHTYATADAAGMLPYLLFAFIILAPLQEELLIRGFIFHSFVPAFGPVITVLGTSLLWALLHPQYNFFFLIQIFGLGIILGWLRLRSGTTTLPFALHAAVNATALLSLSSTATS
jgi:membrane protease YdiL (CAAX protease family)